MPEMPLFKRGKSAILSCLECRVQSDRPKLSPIPKYDRKHAAEKAHAIEDARQKEIERMAAQIARGSTASSVVSIKGKGFNKAK